MRRMINCITSLLLAISMAVTPVVSVLATTVTDNTVHAQDPNVMPCHEMASGDVVKNKPSQVSVTHRCKHCSEGSSCQDGFLCSSCGHSAHLAALSSPALLARHRAGDSYRSDLLDSYPSLIPSPAFRPPIR